LRTARTCINAGVRECTALEFRQAANNVALVVGRVWERPFRAHRSRSDGSMVRIHGAGLSRQVGRERRQFPIGLKLLIPVRGSHCKSWIGQGTAPS